MTSQYKNVAETLRLSVAKVIHPETGTLLGSAFLTIEPQKALTCFHVVGDPSESTIVHRKVLLRWPNFETELVTHAEVEFVIPEFDLAILKLQHIPTPEGIHRFSLDSRVFPKSKFLTFGYRNVTEFKGLYAQGEILGYTSTVLGQNFIQLNGPGVDIGMSGAPIVELDYNRVVGLVSSFWDSRNQKDENLSFAAPLRPLLGINASYSQWFPRITPNDPISPGNPLQYNAERSELWHATDSRIFSSSLLLVLLDQYEDGSWARTLHRATGGAFTIDTPDTVPETSFQKKAISVTSWAAQTVFKTVGANNDMCLHAAKDFLNRHCSPSSGAFGNVYRQRSNAPFIDAENVWMENPRHTATAAKFFELMEGLSPTVVAAASFLVNAEHSEGGWGETMNGQPNTLSTVYAIDTLLKLEEIPNLPNFLDSLIWNRLQSSTIRAFAWLAEKQDRRTGLWSYRDNTAMSPFYTVNVLAFAPSFAQKFPSVAQAAIDGLFRLEDTKGIPNDFERSGAVAPTAMLIYALSRIDREKYASDIERLICKMINLFYSDDGQRNYLILDGIFVLALTSLPNVYRNVWQSTVDEISQEFQSINIGQMTKEQALELANNLNLPISSAIEQIFLTNAGEPDQ